MVRRLWDSWEDDAEIRDAATGRFIDRDKLHYIDFEGRFFIVKGPSITPRPPQGQPVVAALAHSTVPYRLAARQADLVFVTPRDRGQRAPSRRRGPAAEAAAGRARPLHVFADLVVFLDDDRGRGRGRKDAPRRARRRPRTAATPRSSPARRPSWPTCSLDWQQRGFDGFRLRPGVLPHDLDRDHRRARAGAAAPRPFRDRYAATTLRGQLGLPRPANRYAARLTA